MRLIKTQANKTRHGLKEAERITKQAIDSGDYRGLRNKLTMVMGGIPVEALKLIEELALYEAGYSTKKLQQYSKGVKIKKPTNKEIVELITVTPVSVSLNRKPATILDTYQLFVDAKVKQLVQIAKDVEVEGTDADVAQKKVSDTVNGLFTVQNLALAGVAIIAGANLARQRVASKNNRHVEWSAILDEATCPFCDEMDGQVFDENDITDEIPAHANCRCTWIIVE